MSRYTAEDTPVYDYYNIIIINHNFSECSMRPLK